MKRIIGGNRPWLSTLAGCAVVVLVVLAGALRAAQPEPAAEARGEAKPHEGKRLAQLIRVSLPITPHVSSTVQQAVRRALDRARREDARAVLIFEFTVPGGGKPEETSRGSQASASLDLAKFLTRDEVNSATTVAYLPKSITGHAVLVAMACERIVMAPDATIGSAGIDEIVAGGKDGKAMPNITDDLVSAYRLVAGRRKTVPEAIALGMLDSRLKVIRATTESGTSYVNEEQFAELGKHHTIRDEKIVKQAGERAQFSGVEGRNWDFVSYLAKDRREVARGLELPPESVKEDPSLDGQWTAMRVDLRGAVTADKAGQVQNLIEQQIREKQVNLVVLWLDSPGGSGTADYSVQLANFLADLEPDRVRTVAYIPNQARADAALIAMACDEIVMHPDAVLGGAGEYQMRHDEIQASREDIIRAKLAPRKTRSWSLWAAMIDPQLTVYPCSGPGGETEYFSDEELKEQKPQAGRWTKDNDRPIKLPGKAFSADGKHAKEYRLANLVVENLAQFKQNYGLENDPTLVEPGWAEFLVEALRSREVAILLLIIGGAALYIELHAPGIGIGGFVAAVCFLLFFWSNYLGGTLGWLQVLLFFAGIACIMLELFVVPGVTIFGLGGAALVLASLVLASQRFVWPNNEYQMAQMQRSLLTVAAAGVGLVVTLALLRRWLPHAPIFNRMFLQPPEGKEAEIISRREMLVDLDNLVGARGTATTPLGPGGKARFGNILVDVITDGEFVPRGSSVVVLTVQGNRVLVGRAAS